MTTSYLKTHFFPSLIIIIGCFSTCFSSYPEDPFAIFPEKFDKNHVPVQTQLPHFASLIKHGSFDLLSLLAALNKGSPAPVSPEYVVNVEDFGARSDGKDDTEAFKKAWENICSSTNGGSLVVPKNKTYSLKPISFEGPCKSPISLKIYGTIRASINRSDYKDDKTHWITFEDIQNFKVEGGGFINGNGKIWWKNSCKINKELPCDDAPTAITFKECNNLVVQNLRIQNAQKMHISFQKCVNVKVLALVVTAPGNSPNTDGIHVTNTQNIKIKSCVIRTGDDCISIVNGSKNVEATNIICGPGHGISIGSLGAKGATAYVSNVLVNGAILTGTTNGVRIKTWQGGSGYAKNIKFQNIAMRNVSNPIIIDQNYCDQDDPCPEKGSAVQVSNIVYQNIKGTSESESAIKFDCSKSFPCKEITLQDIQISRQGEGQIEATCDNIKLSKKGRVTPLCT